MEPGTRTTIETLRHQVRQMKAIDIADETVITFRNSRKDGPFDTATGERRTRLYREVAMYITGEGWYVIGPDEYECPIPHAEFVDTILRKAVYIKVATAFDRIDGPS